MNKINILEFEEKVKQLEYNFESNLYPLASPVHNSSEIYLRYHIFE